MAYSGIVQELLYEAARHYKRGKALFERGDLPGALLAYSEALRDLHAVQPQRMRDVLLAQVYLSRYQVALKAKPKTADSDLRQGYAYARTTKEPMLRELAEQLWERQVADKARKTRL